MADKKRAVKIFLINPKNEILMHLRDDKPDIYYPRYWSILGGEVDENESDLDAKTDCGTLCLQHKVNEFLWDLKKHGIAKLPDLKGEPPRHINFI